MDAHTDWQRFAKDRAARLMIWQTNEADAQLVQLYFQTQEEMSSAVIVMRSDFVAGAHYAPALTDELIRFYDSRRDASNAQGLRADWQPPRDDGGHFGSALPERCRQLDAAPSGHFPGNGVRTATRAGS